MVADLDCAILFCRDTTGTSLMARHGDQFAFMSFDDDQDHIGLNTRESRNGTPPHKGHTGLNPLKLLFPAGCTLGQVIDRPYAAAVDPSGAADHGVSQAVYLNDPDSNGLWPYRDSKVDSECGTRTSAQTATLTGTNACSVTISVGSATLAG